MDGRHPGASRLEDRDAAFQSRAVAEKVQECNVQHGDLLADAAAFGDFRAWVEDRLPRVVQTSEGYFTAALVRPLPRVLEAQAAPGQAGRVWVGTLSVRAVRKGRLAARSFCATVWPLEVAQHLCRGPGHAACQ